MKRYVFGLVLISLSASVYAEVKVSNAWVKPTAPGQPVAGAYMQLTSDTDVDVVSASSSVAAKTEIHEMNMVGDVMKMRRIDELALKAGKPVDLKPGGYHLMLIDLDHQIKAGEIVPIELVTRDKAGKKNTIYLKVSAQPAPLKADAMQMHDHQ